MSLLRFITRPKKCVCNQLCTDTQTSLYIPHIPQENSSFLDNALELGGVGEVLGNQAQRGNFLGFGGLRPGQVHFAARLVHLPGGVKSGNKVHRLLQMNYF